MLRENLKKINISSYFGKYKKLFSQINFFLPTYILLIILNYRKEFFRILYSISFSILVDDKKTQSLHLISYFLKGMDQGGNATKYFE